MLLGSSLKNGCVCRRPKQRKHRSASERVCWLMSQPRSRKPHRRQSLMTGTTAMSQSDISMQSRSGILNDVAQQRSRADTGTSECQRMNAEQERSAQKAVSSLCILALPREAPLGEEGTIL